MKLAASEHEGSQLRLCRPAGQRPIYAGSGWALVDQICDRRWNRNSIRSTRRRRSTSWAHFNHAWALPRESALWADFKNEMNGQDVSRWLYNQDAATVDRAGDLGYFIGYRISKAYYDSAPDKAAAIRDIIQVKDGAPTFLARSGYDPH